MYTTHKIAAMTLIMCAALCTMQYSVVPLLLCFLGDIWFIYDSKGYKVAILLFSLGHYGYTLYFVGYSLYLSIICALIVLCTCTNKSQISMALYAVLLLSVIYQIHIYHNNVLVQLGYTLFGVSDAVLLVRDFYWDFQYSHIVVLSTYFIAQFLLSCT